MTKRIIIDLLCFINGVVWTMAYLEWQKYKQIRQARLNSIRFK